MTGHLVLSALAFCMALGGWSGAMGGSGRGSEFERRVEALSEAGFAVSFDDLEERYVLEAGTPNAADIYIKAFEAYVKPTEEERPLLPLRGSYRRKAGAPLPSEVLRAIESSLKNNSQTLQLLDEASGVKDCLLPRTRYEYRIWTDHLSQMKKAAQLLNERNLYLTYEAPSDLLFESLRTTFAHARCCSSQPFTIDYLVLNTLEAMALYSLEESLNRIAFSDGQLVVLFREIQEMRQSDVYRQSLVNERVDSIEFIRRPADQQIALLSTGLPILDNSLRAISANNAGEVLDFYACMIEAAQLPPFEQLKRIEETCSEYDREEKTHLTVQAGVNRRVAELHARITSRLLCAEAALAIERYRLKYGNCPETLRQLAPKFLDDAPVDPFDGELMRYHRLDDGGFAVYTIGPDRKDNGGLSREEMTKVTGDDRPDEYDCPFTVRRRPVAEAGRVGATWTGGAQCGRN